MKNKLIVLSYIFLFLSLNISYSYAQDFIFESSELEILEEGNVVTGKNGVKIISDNQIVIRADNGKYIKNDSILYLEGKIEIIDPVNKVKIYSNKIVYYKKIENILSEGDTKILIDKDYKINSKNITYFRNQQKITSDFKVVASDNKENKYFADKFQYFINDEILKASNLRSLDKKRNEIFFNEAMVNLKKNEFLGKDVNIDFENKIFGNSSNEPRLKGVSAFIDEKFSRIKKGVFTTCKKNDECPPWVLSAKEVEHDKENQVIYYKDAWLKMYDVPVMYFPKFFHPDPTVVKRSGFLLPKFSDSSALGATLDMPYYHVFSESKDLTFTPRVFGNKKILAQTEYRQENKNSSHIADFSFFEGGGSKSHFFSESKFRLNLNDFEESNAELQLQQTSNNSYLKSYKLESPTINNYSTLHSFASLDFSNDDIFFETTVEVYEDLTKEDSDKYEYIFPNYNFKKNLEIDNEIKGNLSFDSNGYKKEFNTNSTETIIVNNLNYISNPILTNIGIKNEYNLIIKNVNSDSKNSASFKETEESEILSAIMLESSLPLRRIGNNLNDFLTPKLSLRYSPNNSKNISDKERRLDISNIYTFDRIGENSTLEGGQSLTLGFEYELNKKDDFNLFSIDMATVYRDEADERLPLSSSLNKKASDIVGKISMSPNNNLNFTYNFSAEDDLSRSNYDLVTANLNVNNFVTSFEFLQERNYVGTDSYIGNNTSYIINENSTLKFSTRKNRKLDLTEFYNLIYEYKNDCLVAAIEYNKDYYNDADLKPNEEIYFSLTITPFAKVSAPKLNK